jgi:hypothetical protein
MMEACQLMKVSHADVSEALKWLTDDNARMSATYGADIHCCTPGDYIMVGWFGDQQDEVARHSANRDVREATIGRGA